MKPIIAMFAVVAVFSCLFVACDEEKDNNKLLFLLLAPRPASNLILYSTGVPGNGNLGGRAGADALCNASSNKPDGVTNVHAFLSVNSTDDEIRDMPGKYGYPTDLPITNASGSVTIADNWADLLDGAIANSLFTAGILADGALWWSGSNPEGSYDSGYGNCNGFMDGTSSYRSLLGGASLINGGWIGGYENYCNTSYNFLCLGTK